MNAIQILKTFGPIDARSVQRDSLLRWLVPAPLATAAAMRWGVPYLMARFSELIGVDLVPYYPPLVGYFVILLMPALAGVVTGFLLLDQRDDRTLTALQVTPLSLNGYLFYRLFVPVVLSVIVSLIAFPLANLVPMDFGSLLLATLGAAPFAPLTALFLAAFAANKVQGFALQKAAGVLFMFPLVAYFIPSAWTVVLGIFPTYWPAKLFWALLASDANAWIYLLGSLLYHTAAIMALLRRYNRVMHE